MSAFEILSFTFTISSILLGAATFLLGFYLVERNRGALPKQLNPFKYLLICLVLPLFLIVPLSMFMVYTELAIQVFTFVVICTVVFFIPVIAILSILALHWS
jgi:hypothetical protein